MLGALNEREFVNFRVLVAGPQRAVLEAPWRNSGLEG